MPLHSPTHAAAIANACRRICQRMPPHLPTHAAAFANACRRVMTRMRRKDKAWLYKPGRDGITGEGKRPAPPASFQPPPLPGKRGRGLPRQYSAPRCP